MARQQEPSDLSGPARGGLPVLVMLPGTLCDRRMFRRQRAALRGLAEVLLIDYRKLRPGRDWLGQLLARLPPRFSLLGFSLGGLWALELMRHAPLRVERLAMVASNAQAASPRGRRKNAWLWRLWRGCGPAAVARRVKPAYFHHEACRRRHARLVRDMALGTRAPTARAEFAWAATRPDGHELLARFQGPLLLVSGAQDPLCPRRWQIEMADAQPQARWVELPRVGHFVPLEAPAPLRDELIRWMRSQVATPPFASPSS